MNAQQLEIIYKNLDQIVNYNKTSDKKLLKVTLSKHQFKLFKSDNRPNYKDEYYYSGLQIK